MSHEFENAVDAKVGIKLDEGLRKQEANPDNCFDTLTSDSIIAQPDYLPTNNYLPTFRSDLSVTQTVKILKSCLPMYSNEHHSNTSKMCLITWTTANTGAKTKRIE